MTKRVKAISDHLYSEINGEGVILSLETGKYYGLNEVGHCIWNAIQSAATFEEIQSAVMAEYDVSEEVCRQEIISFVEKMSEEKLVEISDEENS